MRRVGISLALFLLAGCGGAQSSPEGTVRSFLDALESRDTAAFQSSFTDSTRQLVREIEQLSREAGSDPGEALTIEEWCRAFCNGVVEGTTLEGDQAAVRVRIGDTVEEMPLSRIGDRWKIDLTERLEPAVQMLRLAVMAAGDGAGGDGSTDTIGGAVADTAAPLP